MRGFSLSSNGFRFGRRPEARPAGARIVPMINMVFLLLVFLLLTAKLAPSAPIEIDLPEAEAALPPVPAEAVLYLGADGVPVFGALRGEAALATLPQGGQIEIRADAALAAEALARLLPRLAGASEIRLATEAP
jgi:biopolymer transport protein ExbD